MIRISALILSVCALTCSGFRAEARETGRLLRTEALKTDPRPDSTVRTQLTEGTSLEIIGRSGSWYHVKSADSLGWVSLFSVRIDSQAVLISPSTPKKPRRIYSRSIVMGVRGLDTLEFEKSEPDYSALESLEKFVPEIRALERFSTRGQNKLIPTDSATLVNLTEQDEADERAAGREIAATVLGNVALVENDALQKYINIVGCWVAMRSDRPRMHWRFGVLDSEAINAFAVPGGWIFVTRGLMRRLSSESELAGVIGHEVAHIVSRDHFRLLMVLGAVKKIGSAMAKTRKGSDALNHATSKLFGNATRVMTMALDQKSEFDADRVGTLLATDSGYEPFGLTRALQLIESVKLDSPQVSLLSKTHPSPRRRVQSLEDCASGRILSRTTYPNREREWQEARKLLSK